MLNDEMLMITICQEMNWTYQDYVQQPAWFIELLNQKMQIDSKRIKKQINTNRVKSNIR